MKHCHCGLKGQIKKFKAGKLGLLGGILIIGHLLLHVAECLILPAFLIAFHPHNAEAVEDLTNEEFKETTFATQLDFSYSLQADFFENLEYYYPLKR